MSRQVCPQSPSPTISSRKRARPWKKFDLEVIMLPKQFDQCQVENKTWPLQFGTLPQSSNAHDFGVV